MISSKERTRKYRERLREDRPKYEKVKEKDKERKMFDYWAGIKTTDTWSTKS